MDNCLGVDRLAVNTVEAVDIMLVDMMVDMMVGMGYMIAGMVGMVVGMESHSCMVVLDHTLL